METLNTNVLVPEVAKLVLNAVNLNHLSLQDIHADTSLMQGGLGLDSVDILEVIVAVENRFGVKIKNAEAGKKYFGTIGGIAEWIVIQKTATA